MTLTDSNAGNRHRDNLPSETPSVVTEQKPDQQSIPITQLFRSPVPAPFHSSLLREETGRMHSWRRVNTDHASLDRWRGGGPAPPHDIQQRQRHRDTRAAEKSSAIKLHGKLLVVQRLEFRITSQADLPRLVIRFAAAVPPEQGDP